jgi:hypothetical protein
MTDLSTEELLEILEKAKKNKEDVSKKNKKINSSVNRFIQKFNIKAGNVRVPNSVIHYYYRRKFSYPETAKVSRIELFRQFSKLYESRRTGKSRFYLLNEAISLDSSTLEEARNYEKKYQKRVIKKSKSKEKVHN